MGATGSRRLLGAAALVIAGCTSGGPAGAPDDSPVATTIGDLAVDDTLDGPNSSATGAPSWRLLGEERAGDMGRTRYAPSQQPFESLWRASGLTSAPPPVDFASEIVIAFGATYGSGCDIVIDDVVVDHEQALVHAVFTIPDAPPECNADANPHTFVVAVPRSELPVGPFTIRLSSPDDSVFDPPEADTSVPSDLSAPSATTP